MNDRRRRYVVATRKGGPGKTTTAWHMLFGLAWMGFKTLGIDADRGSQGLTDNYRLAFKSLQTLPFSVLQAPADVDVYRFAQEWEDKLDVDRVVIDCGGEDVARFKRSVLYCDQLVSPVGPQRGELRRMPATWDDAMEVAATHEFDMAVLLTRVAQPGQGAALAARRVLTETDPNRKFYVLQSEVRRSNALYGDGAWGRVLKGERVTDLHDYSHVIDELEGHGVGRFEPVEQGRKSTSCAGGCCYNALKDECVAPDCSCHAVEVN